MIITRISGGLGNQMFQYALGKTLALKNKTSLFLDTSFYERLEDNTPRQFLLDNFNTAPLIATEKDLRTIGLPNMVSKNLLSKIRRRIFKIKEGFYPNNKKLVIESSYKFNPLVLDIKSPAYLVGVWQSYKYFKDIEDIIKTEFTLKKNFSVAAGNIHSIIIGNPESVSVHIRRGDYVANLKTQKKHGLCPPEYYIRAADKIRSNINNPVFFIFSDDIEYAKGMLNLPEAIFVSSPNISETEELILMKECKHNILANSSFSWWAAWLNSNPNKIVIAPKRWFATNTSTIDLIPLGWIQL